MRFKFLMGTLQLTVNASRHYLCMNSTTTATTSTSSTMTGKKKRRQNVLEQRTKVQTQKVNYPECSKCEGKKLDEICVAWLHLHQKILFEIDVEQKSIQINTNRFVFFLLFLSFFIFPIYFLFFFLFLFRSSFLIQFSIHSPHSRFLSLLTIFLQIVCRAICLLQTEV